MKNTEFSLNILKHFISYILHNLDAYFESFVDDSEITVIKNIYRKLYKIKKLSI